MISVTVEVSKDTARPALRRLQKALQPSSILRVMAASVQTEMIDNFWFLEAQRPNKLGGERQHYFNGAAKSTGYRLEGDVAVVFANYIGIRMKYYGGTITAGKGGSCVTGNTTRYLTIPATAEAYGHRACDFPDLTVLYDRRGPYALARVTKGLLVSRKASGVARAFGVKPSRLQKTEILFWLKDEVTIPADPSVLPSGDKLSSAIRSDFNRYVALAWKGAQAA